ncbi:uncharacterized protein [Acropora muricata]|uniref:uncharacterized protein n=1 Tax=Acropora muricata TaxID=159855 RepID=UPI0034E43C13
MNDAENDSGKQHVLHQFGREENGLEFLFLLDGIPVDATRWRADMIFVLDANLHVLLLTWNLCQPLSQLCVINTATSHGTQSSVNDLSGGHCNHTSKNVHMKIEVYVCNKTGDRICNSRNVGILTCPSPATTAPNTSPDTITLTQTEQRSNITESVVTDKSETVSKLPRTDSWPGSTNNEAKRGKRIAENEMRKTRNLWMAIAIGASCFAGVLLTLIVIFVVRCYCFGNSLFLSSLRLNTTLKVGLSHRMKWKL